MIDFKDFKIKRGPAKDLHSPRLIVEEGYWYLSTDSAELFIGIVVDGVPQLKPINGSLIETSLATYATKDFVAEAIASIDIPEVDLTGVATEDWVKSQNYLTEHQDISGKQNIIDDLEEIRTGAALGKTALQEIPAEYAKKDDLFSKDYNDLENKPTIPEAYDDSELRNLINSKADSTHSHEEYALAEHIHEQYLTKNSEIITELYNEISVAYGIADGAQTTADEAKDLANQANNAIANIEHPATPTKVSELENDANYTNEARVVELIQNNISTKIGIDFVTDITVGHLDAGTTISKDMTISQLIYRILFAGSQPDEPEVPEGIVGEIVTDELPLYYVDESGSLAEIPFEITTLTEEQAAQEPTKSGFYQVVDGENNIIESGYHDLSVANQDLIYMIALPKSIKAENISVQTYSDEEQIWEDNTFELTDDISVVNEICDIYGMDISNIDTDKYTVWVSASENVCTGSKIRYIITE